MATKDIEFSKRLGLLLDKRAVSEKEFREKLGVAQSAAYAYLHYGRIPEAPILHRLAHVLGVTMEHLLTGEGERPETIADTDGDYYKAPLVAGGIAAGPGRIIRDEDIKSYVWIYLPKLKERKTHHLIAVEIGRGERSMKPTLLPGDIVLIDTDDPRATADFRDRRIYAIRTEDGACRVKRLSLHRENILIESDNRDDPTEISWTNDLKRLVIGRVVWAWRNLLEI